MILFTILFLIAIIFTLVYLVRGILHAVQKKAAKPMFIRMFVALGVAIISLIVAVNFTTDHLETNVSEESKKETSPNTEEEDTNSNNDTTGNKEEQQKEEVDEDLNNEEENNSKEKKERVLTEYNKDEFTDLTIDQLKEFQRRPDEYKEERVIFNGTILQEIKTPAEDIEMQYRVAVNDDYDNVVFLNVVLPKESEFGRLIEGDYVKVYASYKGLYSYQSTGGSEITIPEFSAYGKLIELE